MPFGLDAGDPNTASRSFLLRLLAILGFVVAAVTFATCRGTGTSGSAGPTSTSLNGPSSSIDIANLAPSTSAAPLPADSPDATQVTLPEDALPNLGLATPQAAARNLWDSWRDRDRPRALLYASPRAVDRLFDWTWEPQVRQAGCTPIEAGWLCRFEGPKQRWDSQIKGSSSLGYRVTSLRIGDPAGDLIPPDSLPTVTNLTPVTGLDGSPVTLGPALPEGVSFTTLAQPLATLPDGTPVDGGETTVDGPAVDGTAAPRATKAPRRLSTQPGTTRRKTKRSTTVQQEAPQVDPEPESEPEPEPAPETKAKPKPEPAPEKPADDGPVQVEGGPPPVPE